MRIQLCYSARCRWKDKQWIMLCCDAGAVYTWGQNQDGQLGLGDCQGRATPTLIEDAGLESRNVVKVAFHVSDAD